MTHVWRHLPGSLVVLTLLAGCVTAASLHRDGLAAVERGDYVSGVADLSQAVVRDPGNVSYRMDYETRREAAVESLVAKAATAQRAAELDTASALYRQVLALDPSNSRAHQGLDGIEGDRRRSAYLDVARRDYERKDYDAAEAIVQGILAEEPRYAPAQELAATIKAARRPVTVAPRLRTRDNHKVTLQLRDAPTKMVFEVLQRETGINFILDKDLKSDSKTSIFVQDVPVEEAIDLVLDQNQLARQILADNMVLIYPNIASKQKDYEQQIVRTFYLTNAAPKDVEGMLKTVLGAKTLFIDERANMVVIRDTPEAVRMAEKLVASLDVAEPEVMLEVEVLEISRSAVQDLGIEYPGSAMLTPSPLGTAAASAASTTGGLVLSDLAHQNSHTIGVSALSVTLNAMKTAGVVTTLASPRIRTRNKEKAKVLIGSREPVLTNSVTPTVGGSVVTGSVQYLDVGLTLEVQPTVYQDGDVAIKLNLEVSSILKQVTSPQSGSVAYEIGTRNANTLLRLKDGETQILGGLIQESDTRTANSIPGLGDIPILSHLFGTNHTDREKDEIVLSITPHIVRMQTRPDNDNTEFWYGSETRTRAVPYSAAAVASGPAGSAERLPESAPVQQPPAQAPAEAPVDPTRLNVQPAMPNDGPQAPPPQVPVPPSSAEALPASQGTPLVDAAAKVASMLPITTPPATVEPSLPPPSTAATPTAASAAGPRAAVAAGGAGTSGSPTPSALSLEGPTETRVGDEFRVTVHLATAQSITRLRSQLRYDGTTLKLINAAAGDLVPAAAGDPKVDTRNGSGAQLEIVTTPAEPVQGNGTLMVLTFKALVARPATSVMAMLNVLGGSGAAVGNTQAAPLKITVRP